MRNATLAAAIAMALPLPAAFAQETPASTETLGEIIVTAQRRSENIQDVPISVSALEGERLSAMFEGGGDIQVLAARVPSLYAESSNGRARPALLHPRPRQFGLRPRGVAAGLDHRGRSRARERRS